jgi:beta-glucanase (GH16 family)
MRRTPGVVAAVLALSLTVVTAPGDPAGALDSGDTTVHASGPDCGGVTIPKAGGGDWACTFDEEFDGTTLNQANWAIQTTAASGFSAGPACFTGRARNVSVRHGMLSLTARKEAAPFWCAEPNGGFSTRYTSGEVLTYGRFSQAYGRFEVSARFPATTITGLQESLWLWPDDPTRYGAWPASGEIDIAEVYSLYADRAVPTIHYAPLVFDANTTNYFCLINDISQFHRYAVEWTPSTITISYDGQTCLSDSWNPMWPLSKPQPFDQPFMVALTQALGVGVNAFDPATTPLPATTQVDYVRVWK